MKKIKCLSMVILALGFFAFSANAQNVKEVRKQGLAKKMKTHKTIEAAPQLSEQTVTTSTAKLELKAKPSANKTKFKPRPNAKKQIKSVTVQNKSSIKVAESRAKRNFSTDQQKRATELQQRISNRQFDMNTAKQKIKKLRSNQ